MRGLFEARRATRKVRKPVETRYEDPTQHPKSETEKAYRRGVHQSFAMLAHYLAEHEEEDAVAVLAEVKRIAGEMRWDGKAHPFLLDEVFRKVQGDAG